MLSSIYVGIERGEECLKSSPRRSNPHVATTIRRPDQGKREGSTSHGSLGFDGPENFTNISSLLSNEEREHLRLMLVNNIYVFAWKHLDMIGINPTMASHKLNIIPAARPIRHKVRYFHPIRHQIIQTKVDNLLRTSFIREVKYLEWLANVVVAPKIGGKWQLCVDYTDLNEACPKDSFPLPRIDQIVDAAVEHGILSFLDAFSGYHQILLHSPDAEKTTFFTLHGLYCYDVMPFSLKNVRATYQRMVTKIFRSLLDNTMEAYIDDILMKSKECFDHTKHLQEVFEPLQRYGMKLNPLKCTLEVSSGKFFSFMVTQRGIEANPIQLKAIMDSQAPTSRKEVQQLTGRLAALGRFISHFIDRLKPFFITLRIAKRAD